MVHSTKDYLVAYLDLLGAKNYIRSDTDDKFLNLLYNCYEEIIGSTSLLMPITGIHEYKVKIFSDNIVFAIPSNTFMRNDHHPVIALNRIQTLVCAFQRYFLENDILVRGGVTFGKLFIDDVFVWGNALIDAYNLENNVAEYPRVIIDRRLQRFEKMYINDDPSFNYFSSLQIKEDFDGAFFFDYLNFPDDKKVMTLVDNSLERISEKIKCENDQRILKKYMWHRNYLLYCINERTH